MLAEEDAELTPSQEHIKCIPTFRATPPERQQRAK